MPPKTQAERRLMMIWAIPTTGSMLLVPLAVALWRDPIYDFGYLEAVLYIGIMMLVFCVYDLIVLDWLITVWWRPQWMRLPGAESMMHHDNVRFHLTRSIKGLPFPIVGAALSALPFVWL